MLRILKGTLFYTEVVFKVLNGELNGPPLDNLIDINILKDFVLMVLLVD